MRYRLRPSGKLDKQLRRLYQSLNEDVVVSLIWATREPEPGIHQARKSCKEIRALLRLLKPRLPQSEFLDRKDLYRSVAAQLSGHRDAMVMLNSWREMQERDPEFRDIGFRAIEASLEHQCSSQMPGDDLQDDLLGLAQQVESWRFCGGNWSLPANSTQLVPNLERLYRRARKTWRQAEASGDLEDFHEFRKRSKDLFYSLRMVRPLYGKALTSWVSAFEAMTEIQGLANDQTVLREFLASHGDDLAITQPNWNRLQRSIQRREAALQSKAFRQAAKLLTLKPKAFVKKLNR